MKKALFLPLSLCMMCIQPSHAQSLSGENMDYYTNHITTPRKEARTAKDYSRMVLLSYAEIGFLESLPSSQLSEEHKKAMKAYLYYNLACFLSLDGDTTRALDVFQQCCRYGYRDYKHACRDTDLDPLRNEPEFIRCMDSLACKYDFGTILKKSGDYNCSATDSLPQFTYLSRHAPQMKMLRDSLHIDSIAGKGDDVSRIKNLLHYIHTAVRHDGSSVNPPQRNTLDMLKVCREENRGINCRMMAIMLSECCMAAGIPARFITCMPKDSTDMDCHVITAAWSEKLKKWIWADPTFDVMMYDDNGVPMSISEVRNAFMQGRDDMVHMSPDANWNGEKYSQDTYFDYMKKNLYFLTSPTHTGYNTETLRDTEYVCLHGDSSPWNKTHHTTRCEDYFWQAPQKKDMRKN